ncbi:MAG: diaminopimelate epimerase [Rikenellaceae bacterium]
MTTILFDKMHGAGNDYVYINACEEQVQDPESLAIKISDRHFGVGSDGLVLIMKSYVADFRMRMFNADGSEAGMCGNASRCVGKYLYEKGLTEKTEITLETKSGIKILRLDVAGNLVSKVSVDMDMPKLEAGDIPLKSSTTLNVDINGREYTCVNMGNPHAVTFIKDSVKDFDVHGVGREIENHPLFPERTNVEFARVLSPERIEMRVWERGSGETLACGTGACATLVAAVRLGLTSRKATIELLGGEVEVSWSEETNRVTLTGGADFVFNGNYIL